MRAMRTPLYSPGEDVAGPDAPQVPLLDRLSAWLVEESPGCVDFQVEGEDHHVEFCTGRRFAFEGLIIDLDTRRLETGDGRAVALTSAEFDLLACFVVRPRRVLSRRCIKAEAAHSSSASTVATVAGKR